MSLVRLNGVTKRYDDRQILRDVSLRLADGDRIGLIGQNGTGKTTLLRLILGRDEPTSGKVDVNAGIRIGYFSQFSELEGHRPVQEVLTDVFAEVRAVESELAEVGTTLESVEDNADMERLLDRQAHLLEEMNHRGGWDYPRHIDTALTKLGFNEARRALPIDQLSGGWRNRAALAHILLGEPEVLLLDEPTNFLDVEGIAWLEEWLQSFRGGLLLISHDRQFLDRVVTRIVEVENYQLHDYPGDYSNYVRKKPFRMKMLERQFEHEEELLALEAEAVSDREELAKDARPSALRRLAEIKKRRPPRPVQTIVTDVYSGLRVPDDLCRTEELSKAYGDHTLFSDLTFELRRGERLAIVGRNGCGKSTLLRILTGVESPDRGKVAWASSVEVANFNTMVDELDPKDTVTHAVNVFGMAYHAQRRHVNRFLSLLRFSEIDLNQRIGTLSGGQRARVALAKCLLSGAAVLVLDEPTNHLDLTSSQVMEQALIHFPGSVIVVSHDRFFLDKVATRLLIFEGDGRVRQVEGGWTMSQGTSTQD